MTRFGWTLAFALLITTFAASAAVAQTRRTPQRRERGAIYVNGAYQTTSSDVQSTVSFSSNLETGTFTSRFRAKPKGMVDVGGRLRVWKNISIGAGYTNYSTTGAIAITGQVPHPFFFGRTRAIEGTTAGERKEGVTHLRAIISSAPGKKLQFSGFAGVASFSVTQTLVDRVNYTDAYPFDTATYTSATTRRESTKKTGAEVGGDASYYFMKHLGVGLSASYSKVTFGFRAADDSTVTINAGGAIAGLGVRLRF